MNNIEQIKKTFDKWALSGRADQIEIGHTHSVNEMLKLIISQKNFSFLDIGCGNGWTVRKLVKFHACKDAYGIDVSNQMIQLANKRSQNGNEHYICADFCEWNYKKKFNIIFSMEALYYIQPIKQVFNKIYSILEENGLLIIGMDFYKENKVSIEWPQMVGLDMQLESIKAWEGLLRESKFKDIHIMQVKDEKADEEWKRNIGTLVMYATKILEI